MTFRKVAAVERLGHMEYDSSAGFKRVAHRTSEGEVDAVRSAQASYYLDGSAKIDVRGILERTASEYAISPDPSQYLYEVIRANTTSVFNDNHDGFERGEVLRYDPQLKTAVYLTYREKPHHVNHRAENPKRARGIILDAHYNAETTPLGECPGCKLTTSKRANRDKSGIFCNRCGTVVNDEFVEIVVAIDKHKDPAFARAVQTGQLRYGSMGCTCQETVCNVCSNVARQRSEFCSHIASHKGTYWARSREGGSWAQVSSAVAKAEMAQRKRAFHPRDFVQLRAEDGYEVRKAAEWCQGVQFDEYSRVHIPADPKAERIELLSKAANADDPTPNDLRSETMHLIAASRASKRRRPVVAAQEKTAMQFHVVRVDGEPLDTFAAETLDAALGLANPDPGSAIEVAVVDAEDASAARLQADSAEFQPLDTSGAQEHAGDVTVNIDEGSEEVDIAEEPETIDTFTDDVMSPETAPEDEEFSPAEMGIVPEGASKEAGVLANSSYSDWKVQVTPGGNARVDSPRGPVLLITPKTAATDVAGRRAFGEEVLDYLGDHGLFRTAAHYDAAFHAKFASVVDYAEDDMKEFMDKDTKENVASGGESDMADFSGEDRGTRNNDVREEGVADMDPGTRTHEVDTATENRATDHELGNTDDRPDSATDNQDSDMREPRREFNMGSDDALQNAVTDHTERLASLVGRWVSDTEGSPHKVASYNEGTGQFVLVDQKLGTQEVNASDIATQWQQLDTAPRSYEDNLKRWAKAEIAKARRTGTTEAFRAVRIAAARAAKGLEPSLLKEAVATELANTKVVGHDGVSRAPLEYRGMSDELAVHLTEAAFAEAADRDVAALLQRAAGLLKHDPSYLAAAEADTRKVAHRVPVVTAASMMSELEHDAEDLRRQASAGNLALSPHTSDTPVTATNGASGKIRDALGHTRVGARIQLRQ